LRIRLRQPLIIIIARAVNATNGTSSHDLRGAIAEHPK
jgi:hypothetical protein